MHFSPSFFLRYSWHTTTRLGYVSVASSTVKRGGRKEHTRLDRVNVRRETPGDPYQSSSAFNYPYATGHLAYSPRAPSSQAELRTWCIHFEDEGTR